MVNQLAAVFKVISEDLQIANLNASLLPTVRRHSLASKKSAEILVSEPVDSTQTAEYIITTHNVLVCLDTPEILSLDVPEFLKLSNRSV